MQQGEETHQPPPCCHHLSQVVLWYGDRGGRKVRLIELPIRIRSSDFIGRYYRLMSSSDFCISRLCRFVLSSDSLIFFSLKVGWNLVILNFFHFFVVQMTPKKLKLLWGQTFFLSGTNFSAELAGKFCRFNRYNF
jgi:hypothetical protein